MTPLAFLFGAHRHYEQKAPTSEKGSWPSVTSLAVYDVASRKQVKRVSLGKGCAGILMDPDGSRAFVGCTAANYVAVVHQNTLAVTSHLDVGGGPDGLTWARRP